MAKALTPPRLSPLLRMPRPSSTAAYLAAYGQPAGKLSPYSWTAYDSVAVLIKAVESVCSRQWVGKLYIPRAALVSAVRATSNYVGLSGTIGCDATGECSASGPVFNVGQRRQVGSGPIALCAVPSVPVIYLNKWRGKPRLPRHFITHSNNEEKGHAPRKIARPTG